MNITLKNQTQKTVTINGKRYDSERVIRDFVTSDENKAGNTHVDDSTEIIINDDYVVISSINGEFVNA